MCVVLKYDISSQYLGQPISLLIYKRIQFSAPTLRESPMCDTCRYSRTAGLSVSIMQTSRLTYFMHESTSRFSSTYRKRTGYGSLWREISPTRPSTGSVPSSIIEGSRPSSSHILPYQKEHWPTQASTRAARSTTQCMIDYLLAGRHTNAGLDKEFPQDGARTKFAQGG